MDKIKRNTIRYVDLGVQQGSQQCGVRPCVIVQNDEGNKHSRTVIVAPLTSNTSGMGYPFHAYLSSKLYNIKTDSIVLCEQLRTIDKKFILEFVDLLRHEDIKQINEAIRVSLAI